jgi:hypothetical protein
MPDPRDTPTPTAPDLRGADAERPNPPAVAAAREPGTRLPTHILDALAIMTLRGLRYADMATAVGVPQATVEKLVRDGHNKEFQGLLDGYRKRMLASTTTVQQDLMELVPTGVVAVRRALEQDRDLRLAKDTAWELMDRVFPRPQDKSDVNVNVGFQSVQTQVEINQAFVEVGTKFGQLLETLSKQDPNRHVRTGVDALPSAYEVPTEATDVEPTGPASRRGNGSA